MKSYDFLIIGGGAAGIAAAETIREYDRNASVAVVSDEAHPLYSRVLLPSYLKHRIPREELFLRTVDDFNRKKIDLRLSEEVTFVDAQGRMIKLANGITIGYGALIIATGGRPKPLPFQGETGIAYRLHTIEDADRLYEALVEKEIKKPVVVGSSFISLEFLEIFAANKLAPTLLIQSPHFFERFLDEEGGAMLNEHFRRYNITVHADETVKEIKKNGSHFEAVTEGTRAYQCDAVAVGIGIERTFAFLRGSGVTLGEHGIQVNEFLETDIPGIFAAGDIAEYFDTIASKRRMFGNWTSAVLQGNCAGMNAMGRREEYRRVPSYSISNLGFQITVVGDVEGATETIVRADKTHRQYSRFFLRDGLLAGAVLINRFADKVHIASLIERRVPADPFREKLHDVNFDIHSVAAV